MYQDSKTILLHTTLEETLIINIDLEQVYQVIFPKRVVPFPCLQNRNSVYLLPQGEESRRGSESNKTYEEIFFFPIEHTYKASSPGPESDRTMIFYSR